MKRTHGIIYALLSSAAFGLMPIFAKIAYSNSSNPLTVLSLRFLCAALILFIYFIITGVNFQLSRRQTVRLILVGVLGYTSTGITLFFSYSYISVGLATTMHFIYPALVIVLNYVFYKEPFTKQNVAALLISVIGVYILIGTKVESIHPVGTALALLSGVTYAASVIGMNHPELKELDNRVTVFYFSLSSGCTLILLTILTNNFSLKLNISYVLSIVGISFISTIVSIVLFIKALKIIGSTSTSILGTFEPIVSIIMGILLFGENITIQIILGTILILSSVMLLAKKDS